MPFSPKAAPKTSIGIVNYSCLTPYIRGFPDNAGLHHPWHWPCGLELMGVRVQQNLKGHQFKSLWIKNNSPRECRSGAGMKIIYLRNKSAKIFSQLSNLDRRIKTASAGNICVHTNTICLDVVYKLQLMLQLQLINKSSMHSLSVPKFTTEAKYREEMRLCHTLK